MRHHLHDEILIFEILLQLLREIVKEASLVQLNQMAAEAFELDLLAGHAIEQALLLLVACVPRSTGSFR